MKENLVSDCCKAELVYHQADEGTGFCSCSKCGEGCNWVEE
jgi:hypothetical protein